MFIQRLQNSDCSPSWVREREMMKIQENLGFINVLKQATKLLCGNINLVIFLLLCSIPLFCFLTFFELSLQATISLAARYLYRQPNLLGYYYYYVPQDPVENLITLLLKTFLLYLFPYSLIFDLLTTTTIVSASSTVYMSEEKGALGFGQLVRRTVEICKKRLGGCLITSLYVLFLSTSVFFGFFFAATNYFSIIYLLGMGKSFYYIILFGEDDKGFYTSGTSSFDDPVKVLFSLVMALFHVAVFIVLLAKFSKWSAGWNMGLIVSVLEDEKEEDSGHGIIYGTDALTLSAYYGRGHEERGLWVMLVYLVFALAVRIPCLCFKCSESPSGYGALYTSLYVGLICVGNVIKWVACVICYYDCKTKVLEKKADVEIGSKPSQVLSLL